MASTSCQDSCLFCRISNGLESGSRLLLEKDGLVVFEDHKPASKHHYLVVPKDHVKNPKELKPDDLGLVEQMVTIGKEFLIEQGGVPDDSHFGFHWPPFNSVQHLHLHVISPVREMKFLASMIYKPGTFWFVSSDWLIDHLQSQRSTEVL